MGDGLFVVFCIKGRRPEEQQHEYHGLVLMGCVQRSVVKGTVKGVDVVHVVVFLLFLLGCFPLLYGSNATHQDDEAEEGQPERMEPEIDTAHEEQYSDGKCVFCGHSKSFYLLVVVMIHVGLFFFVYLTPTLGSL